MSATSVVKERSINITVVLLLLAALEAAVLLGCLLSLVPVDTSSALSMAFAKDQYKVKGDHKTLVYHVVVMLVLAAGFWLARFKQAWLSNEGLTGKLRWMRHGLIYFLSMECFALYFILTAQGGGWAWPMILCALLASMLFKVFYPEALAIMNRYPGVAKAAGLAAVLVPAGYVCFAAPAAAAGAFLLLVLVVATGTIGWRLLTMYHPWESLNRLMEGRVVVSVAELLSWIEAQPLLRASAPFLFAALLVSILAIVDPLCVLAKTAFGEHYYHYDFMLMAGSFAAGMGNIMGVDHNVFYGLTLPGMIAWLAKVCQGRVDYLSVLNVYWGLCIIYFLVLFFCLRKFFNSTLLAAAAMLLCVRLQLFFTMSYPITSIYPSCSVLRCLWDIPFFIMLYLHLKHEKSYFLAAAGMFVAIAISYIPTTGVDLYVAFSAYLIGRKFFPLFTLNLTWGRIALMAALPAVIALAIMYWVCGSTVVTMKFWHDLAYYPKLFTNGFYSVWFWDNLTNHYYIDFIAGCMVPLLYLGTMLYIGMRALSKTAKREELITFCIGAYGLSLYHHYLVLAIRDSYFMRAVPLVWTLCFWAIQVIGRVPSESRRLMLRWGLLLCCVLVLLSNRDYQAFPNIWNSRSVRNITVDPKRAYPIPWDGRPYFFHPDAYSRPGSRLPVNSQGNTDEHIFWEWQVPDHDTLKRLYAQEFDFSKDAALIDRLTTPKQKVALLSSFEIAILMQANRRPFFFYFPLIASRGMDIRTFPHTNLYTKAMVQRTIDDLEQGAPQYVFLEKVFLTPQLPADYLKEHEELLAVIAYIKEHYQLAAQGKYLAAMERR